jgi:sortase (surface protein transpeptidase)
MKFPKVLGCSASLIFGAMVAAALIRGVSAAAPSVPEIALTSPDAVVSTTTAQPASTPPRIVEHVTATEDVPVTVTASATTAPSPPVNRSSTTSCPSSIPVKTIGIRIPSIAVSSRDVIPVGLNADHSLQVPPLSKVGELGWFCYSPVPGAMGPAVVLAHDEQQGHHGLFWSLGQVKVGDVVELDRSDGQTATFRVTRNLSVPKPDFDQYSNDVYGNTTTPQLRVITCSGLTSQEVVFADLVSLRPTVGE